MNAYQQGFIDRAVQMGLIKKAGVGATLAAGARQMVPVGRKMLPAMGRLAPFSAKIGPDVLSAAKPTTSASLAKSIAGMKQTGQVKNYLEALEPMQSTKVMQLLKDYGYNIPEGLSKGGSAKDIFAAGFMARAKEHGMAEKQASEFLEKMAFGWGDAGDMAGGIAKAAPGFLWEMSGIPSVGRGGRDLWNAGGMFARGDIWGGTKRLGSSLGHLALGLGGWIPGVGWAGKGLQAAGLAMKGMRGAGMAAKAMHAAAPAVQSAGRMATAWGGLTPNLINRVGTLSTELGGGLKNMGMSNLGKGLTNFGQRWSNIGQAGHIHPSAYVGPQGPMPKPQGALYSKAIWKPSFWSSRFNALTGRMRGIPPTAAEAQYAQYAGRSLPMWGGMIGGQMAFQPEMPVAEDAARAPRYSDRMTKQISQKW